MKLAIKVLNEKKTFLNALTSAHHVELGFAATVAIRTLSKNMQQATADAAEVLNEQLEAAKINNALIGDKGELLLKDDQYQYTREGMLQMQKEQRAAIKAYEAVEVDIVPSILQEKDIPKHVIIDSLIKAELKGLLFK